MNHQKKRILKPLLSLAIVLSLVMLFGMLCENVWAAESGSCGENLTWTLDDNGTLTISGMGAMEDYGYNNEGVYKSPAWSEYSDSIESVIINDGVTTIGDGAFTSYYNLDAVTIPNSVTNIGKEAFWACTSLKILTLPGSVTTIGDSAFYYCLKLKSITISDGLISIGNEAFRECESLSSITIPDSVTSIGNYAFGECSDLETVNYPDTLDIGNAFYYTPWWKKTAPKEGVCGAGLKWSLDSNMGILTINGTGNMYNYDSETNDAPWCIFKDSIKSVVINDGVTSIGNYAFYCCYEMTSATIPDSVTFIGSSAFEYCENLTSVTIPSSFTKLENCFDYTPWLRAKENASVSALSEGQHRVTVTGERPVYFKFVPKKSDTYEFFSTESYSCNVDLCDNKWFLLSSTADADVGEKITRNLTAGKTYYVGVWVNNQDENASTTITLVLRLKPVSIKNAKVVLSKTAFTYNGKVHKPVITSIKGIKNLKSGTDYTVKITNNKGKTVASPKTAGTYTITVTGKGNYTGTSAKATYKINKAANPLTVKAKTAKVKFSVVKKKAQTLAVSKVLTVSKKQGKVTYIKDSGNSKITINKKTGKVTVKKGLKKGTFKVKVKVKAAGNVNYKALTKPATFTVKVN